MPVRAPRVCGHCGGVHAGGERCRRVEAMARERKARHDAGRPQARDRGYDSQWEKAARAFLALPGNSRCACGAPAVVVRHVVSIRRAPQLRMERSNWRPGCQKCNAKDAARERREERN